MYWPVSEQSQNTRYFLSAHAEEPFDGFSLDYTIE